MAITPANCADLTADDLTLLSKAQSSIDTELLLSFESGKTVVVRNAIIREVFLANPRVLTALISTYQANGWNVVQYENVAQGSWLSFSEAA
jgi:hypothetical protein